MALSCMHVREVDCLSKGKGYECYEFGVKASIATTRKGGWHVRAMSLPSNPYDGHSLEDCATQIEGISPHKPEMIFTDQGYQDHRMQCDDLAGHFYKKHGDKTSHRLWKWMKRRSGVELGIGHPKQEHRFQPQSPCGRRSRHGQCYPECQQNELP